MAVASKFVLALFFFFPASVLGTEVENSLLKMPRQRDDRIDKPSIRCGPVVKIGWKELSKLWRGNYGAAIVAQAVSTDRRPAPGRGRQCLEERKLDGAGA